MCERVKSSRVHDLWRSPGSKQEPSGPSKLLQELEVDIWVKECCCYVTVHTVPAAETAGMLKHTEHFNKTEFIPEST